MLAAAAGQHAPGRRKVVVAFEGGERTITIVTRIDVEHDELVGDDAEIGLRRLVPNQCGSWPHSVEADSKPCGASLPYGCFAGDTAGGRAVLPQEQSRRPLRSIGQVTGQTAWPCRANASACASWPTVMAIAPTTE